VWVGDLSIHVRQIRGWNKGKIVNSKVIQMKTCSDVATHVIRTELLRAKPLEGLMGWGREAIFGDCCPSDATCNDSRNWDDNDEGEEPAFGGEIKASPMSKAGGGNEDLREV
jgi:hypothetical protein